MVNRTYLTAIVALASGVWALGLMGYGWELSPSFFKPISWVILSLQLAFVLWDTVLWRQSVIHRWFGQRPDLQGTWRGTIESTYRSKRAGEPTPPIPAFLVVRQTFSSIRIRLMTAESQSVSLSACFSDADGGFDVCTIYRNEPDLKFQQRSRIHHGAMFLRIHGPPVEEMSGAYWTDRDTKGQVQFRRHTTRVANDFHSAARACHASS